MDDAEKIGKEALEKGHKKPKDILKKVYPGEKWTKKEVLDMLKKQKLLKDKKQKEKEKKAKQEAAQKK